MKDKLFENEVKEDRLFVSHLWQKDGRRSSSISILKSVRLNLETCQNYIVFDVYNCMDPSRAKFSGCRVNAEPFLTFRNAWILAKREEYAALMSREWVPVETLTD